MDIKAIKSKHDYNEALRYVESLIDSGIKKDSIEAEKLDVLVTLIQDYESNVFPETTPDPIDALVFVMEQRNLSQEDLVPYIGSRSKVSEVLGRKRRLSLNMIKSLHAGLNIPAEILLNQPHFRKTSVFQFNKLPIKEMIKRGYIRDKAKNINSQVIKFFAPISKPEEVYTLLRKTSSIRSSKPMNQHALQVWVAQVVNKTIEEGSINSFDKARITKEIMKQIVDLSDENNPIPLLKKLLHSLGIYLIAEPHMPQTYLDGAAIMLKGKNPIIGVTIRHDRLDNLWFTIMHELAHISLHYGKDIKLFYDALEDGGEIKKAKEKEADKLALEAMIPTEVWESSPVKILPTPETASLLAKKLSIDPAIVAGRIRYERNQYHLLNSLVGKGKASQMFTEFSKN